MNTVIRSTKNYDMFDLHEMNRDVYENTADFKNLVRSMKIHGFLDALPLHCVENGNGKLKIKGGHNRFRAAQIAGVPVKYVVSNDKATIYDLEKSGPGKWGPKDYLVSFCKQGIKSYIVLQEYIDETGIGLQNAASMFYGQSAGSGNFYKYGKFQSGQFAIKDYRHPRIVGDIVLFLKSIGIDWASNASLVKAISRMVFLPQFDVDRFKQKAEKHKFLIEKQKNLQAYLQMIEDVYNRKVPKDQKVNIAFLAQEAATSRGTLGFRQ